MILLIDNYDSFTFNLAHLIAGVGDDILVKRNDALSCEDAFALNPRAIVLSPGPSTPEKAGISMNLVRHAANRATPLFGVCLGMQAIAVAFGGDVVRADKLMHGKTSAITHDEKGLFEHMSNPFTATRYHSLIASPQTIPDALEVTARSADDNEIMALQHRSLPISGVQFHPESIASQDGAQIIKNFLRGLEAT